MRALRELWTPTNRVYDRLDEGFPRRFVLDSSVSWQNYQDDAGVYREIDLTPEIIAGGFRMRKAPYDATFLATGARRIAPDRLFPDSRYIDLPANRFLLGKTFTRQGSSLVWTSAIYDVRIGWEASRLKFDVILKRPPPRFWRDRIQLDVDKTGIDDLTFFSYLSNLHVVDSSPVPLVRPLAVSLNAGVLTLGWDLTGMVFPVTIDPTLDLQVGAAANDTRHYASGGHAWSSSLVPIVGNAGTFNRWGGSALFTNVTIAQGATIDVAYMTLTPDASRSGATCKGVVDAEDVDSGDAPTSDADWDNEVKTTATVAWDPIPSFTVDVEINTPSIITVLKELVDRAGWASGNNMNIFLHDEASGSSAGAFRSWNSYDQSTTKAPKLHIEYTVGGTIFFLTVTGSSPSAGTLIDRSQLSYAGTLSTSGALAEKAFASHTGSTGAPTGTLSKTTRASVAGSIASLVGMSINSTRKVLDGTASSVGTAVERTAQQLSGNLATAGSLVHKGIISLTGFLASLVGVVSQKAQKLFSGDASSLGSLTLRTPPLVVQIALTGAVALAGALTKVTRQLSTGAITATGVVVQRTQLVVAGTILATSALVQRIQKVVVANLVPVGNLIKRAQKILDGSVSSSAEPLTLFRFRNSGVHWTYHADRWSALTRFYLDVQMRATAGTAYVRLFDDNTGAPVTNSTMSTASLNYVVLRSSVLEFVDQHSYVIQFGTEIGMGGAGQFNWGRIIGI